ncbi:MAG: GGDEF domain-containing protein [Nitrospirae bacterium]|nr:MAG: GGDEF domain-containing protein [Nitrospirota bacterium]
MIHRPRITIAALILGGYGLIFFALHGLGWYATRNMEQLRTVTQDLYAHPFAVSNAAIDMKSNLFQLRHHMLQVVLLQKNNDNLRQMYGEADGFSETIRTDLAVIKANFLGDMNRVRELEIKLDQWDAIRAEILAAVEKKDMETAHRLVRTVGTPKFTEIVPLVDYVQTFAKDRAKLFVDEAERHAQQMHSRMLGLIAVLSVFLIATGFAVLRGVRNLQDELRRQATTDFLTEIPNRRHFIELLDRELARSLRYDDPFALAVADLDLFKTINDTHGHHVGDRVLKKFCEVCSRSLRASDIIGRIGGEEFAVLFPKTGLSEALDVLERLRSAIEETVVMTEQGLPLRFTASFGLAAYASGEKNTMGLFKRADDALYEAKRGGRNKVCVINN